jgi:branched-chain amino acid aminotransferase
MKIYIDGEFFDEQDAKVSVLDHGLLYGDGIFEGIRLYRKNIFRLDEHLERLEYSAKAICMKLPMSREELAEATAETCRRNGLEDGYIRLVVTRGKGSLGLSPASCPRPTVIIIAGKIALYPKEHYVNGLKVITVPTRRVNGAALSPQVKSLNYLNNILAKIEANHLGYDEAFMLNDQGFVAECTGDNVFLLHKGELYTPSIISGALNGITRATAIDIAKELGIPVHETTISRYDLWTADECFLTGTAAEIVPVVEIDARVIGDGKPGKITQRFLEKFHTRVGEEGMKI